MSIHSKFMGRVILFSVLALMAMVAATGQEWWSIDHDQYRSDKVWRVTWTVHLYDDHYLYYFSDNVVTLYEPYYGDGLEPVITLLNTEKTLLGWWSIAGLAFIASVLLDRRILGIATGLATLFLGITAILAFAFGVGPAIENSELAVAANVDNAGFYGVDYYTIPTETGVIYIHLINYGPELGFYLLLAAFGFSSIAVVTRFHVIRQSLKEDLAKKDVLEHDAKKDMPRDGQPENK